MIKIEAKTCNCCKKVHTEIPADAKYSDDPGLGGYFWNCECKSTLFVSNKKLVAQSATESQAVALYDRKVS